MKCFATLFLQVLLLTLVVANNAFAATKLLIREDFERTHDLGRAPAWPGVVAPEDVDKTKNRYVQIVDGSENLAGEGLAVKIRDYDPGNVCRLGYPFAAGSEEAEISALRFSFDFAYVSSNSGSNAPLYVVASRHDSSFSSDKRKLASATLGSDGMFEMGLLDVSQGAHHMDVFINDYEITFTYESPSGKTVSIGANRAHWYINKKLVLDKSLHSNTENSTNNFGRAGFLSEESASGVCYVVDNIEVEDLDALPKPNQPGISSLVRENNKGKLIYSSYANQGQQTGNTKKINTLPDWSSAGYGGGGVSIPYVEATIRVSPGPGDDSARIQKAIDDVAKLQVQSNGFRGAVVLEAGEYQLTEQLRIRDSGIVLRGAGQGQDGTKLIFDFP